MSQSHHRKIQQIYNKTEENSNEIDKLDSQNIRTSSINFNDRIRKYESEWIRLFDSNVHIITLNNFPDEFIKNLKFFVLYKIDDNVQWHEFTKVEYTHSIEQYNDYSLLRVKINGFFVIQIPVYSKLIVLFNNINNYNELQITKA